jgi:hypothetical protein
MALKAYLQDKLASGDIEAILRKLSDDNSYYVDTVGLDVFNIYSEDDFPTPVGDASTLISGKYVMKKSFTLSTIKRFNCALGSIIEWTSDDKENHTLTSDHDNETLFNLILGSRFKCDHASFVIGGDNATFLSIAGNNYNSKFNDFRVTFTGTGSAIGGAFNTFEGTNEFLDGTFAGFKDGLVINNTGGTQVIGVLFISDFTGDDAILKAINIPALAVNFNTNVFIGSASQSNYYLDPTIEVPMQVQNNITAGALTTFFKSGSTGAFTAVADASIGATNITSVTDSSGIARFNFTGGTLYQYQEIVNSTFTTNPDYNGTYIISATDGTTYFEIASIEFGSDETGSFLSNSVTLTESGTTLTDGETILLDTDLSTMYDCGTYVYNKQTNSVQVNKTWVSTITGTWDSGSLTENSKYVNASGNGAQPDSQTGSAISVKGNIAGATDTTTTTNWGPLNLGTAIEGGLESRTKLLDAATGEREYTDLTPLSIAGNISMSVVKSGGAVEHVFRMIKTIDTESDPFDDVEMERSITTVTGSVGFPFSGTLYPGDRFRSEVKAIATPSTITILSYSDTLK